MSAGDDRARPGQEARSRSNTTNTASLDRLPDDCWDGNPDTVDDWDGAYLHQYLARVIVEALQAATAAYWERRADMFQAARAKPGDFLGRSGDEGAERRLQAKVAACRNAASFWRDVHTGEPPRLYCPRCMTYTSPWTCSCGATRIGGAVPPHE